MNEELVGCTFPFHIARGGVSQTKGSTKIEQNMRHLISTRLAERVMLRTYGGGVHHRLQEPNAATLHTLIKHEVEEALRVYMPEVRLTAPIRLVALEEELTMIIEYRADPRDTVRRLELEV